MERFLNDLSNNHIFAIALSSLIITFLAFALLEYYHLPEEKRSPTARKNVLYCWIVLIIFSAYLYQDIASHPDFYTQLTVNGITIAAAAIPSALVGIFIGRQFNSRDRQ